MVKATIGAAAIGIALLAACGKSDREKVQDVAEQFATDLRENRGDPCRLLEPALTNSFGGRNRCDTRLRKTYAAEVGQGKVKVERVYEDSAYMRAEVTVGQVRLSLDDGLDEWLINGIDP